MIEVKGLTKKYGTHTAVNNISFSIEEGKIYGFLGPNGAGKSTTMNMITGCISATDGEVLINGHDIFNEPLEAKKNIGYLPEIPPLYVDFTVREYLKFVCELKKVPAASVKDEVNRVIEESNTQEYADRLIRSLSKGYRQRVGLAQALIGDPAIIILDEPSIGLDPKQIIEMRELIRGLGQKHTVILSSHILSEVSAVCDHILIIRKGELVANGTPEELAKNLASSSQLVVDVIGNKETVTNALSDIDAAIEISDGDEDGALHVTLKTQEKSDLREQVSRKLSAEGCIILGMQLTHASLEDVFLELTDQEENTSDTSSDVTDDSDVADEKEEEA